MQEGLMAFQCNWFITKEYFDSPWSWSLKMQNKRECRVLCQYFRGSEVHIDKLNLAIGNWRHPCVVPPVKRKLPFFIPSDTFLSQVTAGSWWVSVRSSQPWLYLRITWGPLKNSVAWILFLIYFGMRPGNFMFEKDWESLV